MDSRHCRSLFCEWLVLTFLLWQNPLMTKMIAHAILVLGVLFAAQPGDAQPRNVVVGVEELDYAPHYTTLSGSFRGFGRALLDEFAAAEGVQFEYRPLPVIRLHQALIEGRIGFKYPDNPSWQREIKQAAGITYSQPVVGYLDGILVAPGRLARPAEPLPSLALVRGFSLPADTPWQGPAPQLLEQNSLGAAIRATLLGEAEGLFGNVTVLQHQMRQVMMLPPDQLAFDPRLPHQRGHYHLSTRDERALLARFDAWLVQHEPAISAMKRAYGLD